MTRNQRRWWYGLLAGFFGGVWTSIDSGLAVMIIAPKEFNLDEGLLKTLLTMLILGLLAGGKVAVAYLKQSPLPPMNGDTEFYTKPTPQLTRQDCEESPADTVEGKTNGGGTFSGQHGQNRDSVEDTGNENKDDSDKSVVR